MTTDITTSQMATAMSTLFVVMILPYQSEPDESMLPQTTAPVKQQLV